ncbi:MAG: DUF4252 domain-containing protein [Bacteroidaceae bacterium]|nr:DUF4252 domain-containing protein [Bacteroidaceae bacterium]
MKRFIIALALLVSTVASFAQREFINHFGNVDGITSIYVSKTMIRLLPKLDAGNMDLKKISQKLESVQILTSESTKAASRLRKGCQELFKRDSYEPLMEVKESGKDSATIYLRELGKGRNSYVIFAGDDADLSVIVITGTISVEDIQSITEK